jgi:hypothetical protein
MKDPFVIFWAALILGSIAWYGFLVFYVGYKAGRDILVMIASLKADQARDDRRGPE